MTNQRWPSLAVPGWQCKPHMGRKTRQPMKSVQRLRCSYTSAIEALWVLVLYQSAETVDQASNALTWLTEPDGVFSITMILAKGNHNLLFLHSKASLTRNIPNKLDASVVFSVKQS